MSTPAADHGGVAKGCVIALALIAGAVVLGANSVGLASPLGATKASAECRQVGLISVRGSGDTLNLIGYIGGKISGRLSARAQALGVRYHVYGIDYTAVGIDWKKIVLPLYIRSKNEGRDKVRDAIRQQARACPRKRLVIVGFSQGAHAVGDALSRGGGLTDGELEKIAAVVLVADPRFNAKEPFATGDNLRAGHNGILGARSPGDLRPIEGRVRSWCLRDDIVCQGLPAGTAAHSADRYLNAYGQEIVDYIATKLGWRPGRVTTAAGYACAVTDTAEVRCWGSNEYGQLGDGTKAPSKTPVAVRGLRDVKTISADWKHTCALLFNGTVKCWGRNSASQLGDGTMRHRSSPVVVRGLPKDVVEISVGTDHSCALTRSGSAWCWGEPDNGQLGPGAGLDPLPNPVLLTGFPGRVALLSAGGFHTCGLTSSGAAYCWGQNFNGEAGHGRRGGWNIPLPVVGLSRGVSDISSGPNYTCALVRGAVRCWGHYRSVDYATPVDVRGLASGVAAIGTEGGHCAIVRGEGVRCTDPFSYYATPTYPQAVTIPDLEAVSIASRSSAPCAYAVDGRVMCWRDGPKPKPVEVEGL